MSWQATSGRMPMGAQHEVRFASGRELDDVVDDVPQFLRVLTR
jgi:hypothetical protein